MKRKLLGVFGALLYGSFGMISGVAQAHADGDPGELILEGMTPEDMSSEDMEPAYTEARCIVPGSIECIERCLAIGATCSQFVLHPKRVEGGVGTLYRCKGGSRPFYTCSYRFANSDTCHFVRPGGPVMCGYEGGK